MDERVKKYIFRIGSIVLLILICMFIILEIQIKKEHNENLEETSARAVNDIQENTITQLLEYNNTITESNIIENEVVTEDLKIENAVDQNNSTSENKKETEIKTNTSNSKKDTSTSNTKKKQILNLIIQSKKRTIKNKV